MAERLITAAEIFARQHGATVLETYPVEPDSPSYRFMGFVEMFTQAGYVKVGQAGSRRHIMRKEIT